MREPTTMKNLNTFLLLFVVLYFSKGHTTPAFCDLPKDEGSGTEVAVYLYYNKTADRCYPFRYMGQGGNDNRFVAEKYCMRNCSKRAEELYPLDETKACHLPKISGDCYGTYLRYYYDAIHGKCKAFFWTGCVGNGNRFLELQQCNETCFGIIDIGDNRDEDVESDTPVGIILGVTLGIIGAIILIVVLVLTLKKKKPSKSKTSKARQDATKESNPPGPEIPLQTNNIETA